MNIQVNDLAPLRWPSEDEVSAAVALLDAIDNANEIISFLMLHNCSATMHVCSIEGRLDALIAEMNVIERTAQHLTANL